MPTQVINNLEELISEKAAARFLGVSHRTLARWRRDSAGPVCIAISSRCIRYRRADLVSWADKRSTAEAAAASSKVPS